MYTQVKMYKLIGVICVTACMFYTQAVHATVPYDVEVYDLETNDTVTMYDVVSIKCRWSVRKKDLDSSWNTTNWTRTIKVDGTPVLTEQEVISDKIGPKVSYMFNGVWNAVSAGKHTIECAVSHNSVSDMYPKNNAKSKEIYVFDYDKSKSGLELPTDLKANKVKIEQPQGTYKVGDELWLRCHYHLNMQAPLKPGEKLNFIRYIKVDDQVVESVNYVLDKTDTKNVATSHLKIWKATSPGKHKITCEVAPITPIKDSNPANNSETVTIKVSAVAKAPSVTFGGKVAEIKDNSTTNKPGKTQKAPSTGTGAVKPGDIKLILPDLALEHLTAKPSPGCSAQHAIQINVSVRNAGSKASPVLAGNHGLYVDALDDAIVDKRVNLPALKPKQYSAKQVVLASKFQPDKLAGKTIYLNVMVNKEKRVAESDYTNNVRKVRVVFPPDFCKTELRNLNLQGQTQKQSQPLQNRGNAVKKRNDTQQNIIRNQN